jgi:hypothetical protein
MSECTWAPGNFKRLFATYCLDSRKVIIKPWSQKEYLESPPANDKGAAGDSMDAGMGDMDM